METIGKILEIKGMDSILSLLSVIVSVVLVVIQINNNAGEQLKAALAQNRPLIIASMYSHMDLEGKRKCRKNFTRYITKTSAYKAALAESKENGEQKYSFLRIRNESDNHAHGVKIGLRVENRKNHQCFEEEYTINIIASFCEYLIIVPEKYAFGDYFDLYGISEYFLDKGNTSVA